jgi:formylglycine-generating enzyme required for sulfatase activity
MISEEPPPNNLSLTGPWAVVIAAIVIGISAIVVAIIVTTNDGDGNASSNNSSDSNQNVDVDSSVSDPIIIAENSVSSNAEWQPYSPYIREFNGIEMVLVPAGCFMMGSIDEQIDLIMQICEENGSTCERDWFADEQPAHQQCFDEPFWIDRTEVTRAQYAECVTDGKCTAPNAPNDSSHSTQPTNSVTWFQSQDYCSWRDARLPTEREWEYAARGPDSLTYPWGNEFVADNAVYVENSGGEVASVGSRPSGASWVGAMDMSGNLVEWVSSLYQDYEYEPNDGREHADNITDARTLRGGSAGNFRLDLRAANRNWLIPIAPSDPNGFRCARAY